MTNQNNDEVLELAKECGFNVQKDFDEAGDGSSSCNLYEAYDYELLAFASALREKDAKLIAGLVDALDKARNGIVWYSENSDDADDSDTEMLCEIDAALTAAQPTAESFMAEHDARVKGETLKYGESAFICDSCGGLYWEKVSQCDCGFHETKWIDAVVIRKSAKQEGDGK